MAQYQRPQDMYAHSNASQFDERYTAPAQPMPQGGSSGQQAYYSQGPYKHEQDQYSYAGSETPYGGIPPQGNTYRDYPQGGAGPNAGECASLGEVLAVASRGQSAVVSGGARWRSGACLLEFSL